MGVFIDTINRARQNTALRRASATGAVILTGAVIVLGTGGGGGAATANLWVDTTAGVGTCSRAATGAAYSDPSSCSSLTSAWTACQAGDTVRVKTGSYGSQQLFNHSPTMTAAGCTFRFESGVSVASIQFGRCSCEGTRQDADYVSMIADDTTNGRVSVAGLEFAHSSNITFDGFNVNGGGANKKLVYMGGDAKNTTFVRSDIGNVNHQSLIYSSLDDGEGSTQANSGWVFRDTTIHDALYDTNDHTECLFASAMPNTTIERTHWYRCGAMDINIGDFRGAPIGQDNWTIRNSIFECPVNESEVKTCQAWFQGCNGAAASTKPGWLVEYNLLEGTWYSGGGTGCGDTGAVIRGNLGRIGSNCPSSLGATMSKNLWSDNACTGDNTQVSTLFSNSANWLTAYSSSATNQSFLPKSGAVQIDKGTTSGYPPTDYLGLGRYVGTAPDAGPYEFGAT